jgi:hypothetical protein
MFESKHHLLFHREQYLTTSNLEKAVFELENGGIFDVQHEFTAGDVAKSVQIRMDENKFRRLMNEITSNIERRSK